MKLNPLLKVCAFILLAVVIASSCKKMSDPVASYTPEKETALIQEWLAQMATNNIKLDTTSTGIYYFIKTAGSGLTIKTGDSVTVKYTGMFLSGIVFDGSALNASGTYTFVQNDTDPAKQTIKGWSEAMALMNKGESAVFMIPSSEAYGSTGYLTVPPYTPLIYLIEIVDIKTGKVVP